MAKSKPIYTLDLETDPFTKDEMVYPFAAGFYDGVTFKSTWGADCIAQMCRHIEKMPPGLIYLHNGGRFDIFFFLDWLSGKAVIINGRIVKARMQTKLGVHQVRDSYAIMPFPLARTGLKDEIDYEKMRRGVREKHKTEILTYLKTDCTGLHELCTAFIDRFGPQLTVGATAMRELKKVHSFERMNKQTDKELRELYYYGGRVQCFKKGILHGDFKVYDVNSMYPNAMKRFKHPLGKRLSSTQKIGKETFFVTAEGRNYGAFPSRGKDGGLRFDIEEGTFSVSIHEWKAAIALGLFEPRKIIRCDNFARSGTFEDFVDQFYGARIQAAGFGDHILALFYKYVLNACYGKFATNVTNFRDYTIEPDYKDLHRYLPDGKVDETWWVAHQINPTFRLIVWEKPTDDVMGWHNVATAASITGAARSVLMRGLYASNEPIYCDTDSIICESMAGIEIDDTKLGAWKLEKTGNRAAIAGKKMYAIFSPVCPGCESTASDIFDGKCRDEKTRNKWHSNGGCVKHANKGARISPLEIEAAAMGEEILFESIVPTLHWDGSHSWVKRRVRRT